VRYEPIYSTCAVRRTRGQPKAREFPASSYIPPRYDSARAESSSPEPEAGLESSRRIETTALLETAGTDDTLALDRLVPLVYDELRVLAHWQLASERPDHTLRTTALVHEAYVRLVDDTRVTRLGRSYFFGAAARAMRRVLIEHARKQRTLKRGGEVQRVPLDGAEVAVDRFADELIDLDRAMNELANVNPRYARVVECRFFGGLGVEETAEVLGVSARTVKNDWSFARAWLYDVLEGDQRPPSSP